jgi:putative transcription factor
MTTCQNCTKFGKILSRIAVEAPPKRIVVAPKPEVEESVVKNYAALIRSTREKQNLTQEDFAKGLNERLSVIKSIEQGKLVPDLKLAKKLESSLGLKLVEEQGQVSGTYSFERSGPATLGDVIRIRKKS